MKRTSEPGHLELKRDSRAWQTHSVHAASPGSSKPARVDQELYKQCVWVKPLVRCRVEFEEWTSGGNLRHAEFRELLPKAG
jgi:ATP-dependent DNA ligase